MSLGTWPRTIRKIWRKKWRRSKNQEARQLSRLIQSSGLFDPAWYVASNLDVAQSGTDPLHHFVHHGSYEHRDPGPRFETDLYMENYPDWAEGCASPIEHYLRVGYVRGYVARGAPPFERWVNEHDTLTKEDERRITAAAERSPVGQVVFLYVCDAGSCALLDRITRGLESQLGIAWGAHLLPTQAVNASTWEAVRGRIHDPRIHVHDAPGTAVEAARSAAIVVLCLGPVILRPHSGHLFARALVDRSAVAAYSDHDVLAEGQRSNPVFKPEPSPEYLKRVSYAGPVVATTGDHEALSHAIASACELSDGLDLATVDSLLLARPAQATARIPFILYHVIEDAGRQIYRSIRKRVDAPLRLEEDARSLPSVDIIIPTRDRVELLRECLASLATTSYSKDKLTLTIADNDSEAAETFDFFDQITSSGSARVLPSPGRFNFARINNDAARAANAEVLVFLNNDTTVLRPDWLLKLVKMCTTPGVGAVGAMLLYPDDTIQHGGVALGVQGVGAHRLVGKRPDDTGPLEATREMTSVTGACLAVRRDLFEAVGGFDPVLEVAFNDVSLCAKLYESGYRNIYVAEPLLVHHESKSRGFDDEPWKVRKQAREAIYARTRFRRLFQNDPSYSPNRSLQKVDELAFPPRVVRPWRRPEPGSRRVLFLSRVHQQGNGVPVVLAEQAAHFRAQGWEVIVGGPATKLDLAYPGCERVLLVSARQAASYAVSHGVDCVIAHTPPFFSVVRFLGEDPATYFVDHGEPNPDFFAEREEREAINWEKRFCAPMAKRVFAISRTVYGQQYRADAIVIRNGNSHLARWSTEWEEVRLRSRREMGLAERFVVLNVCRFAADDRRYKGVDRYVEVANEFGFQFPALKDRVAFHIAGRGVDTDVAALSQEGVEVHANISDGEMQGLYAASDLYMNFSRWEGYNLGIGQALAMGLPVIASDIEAHREFPIITSNDVLTICTRLAEFVADDGVRTRKAFVEDWREPVSKLEAIIAADVAARPDRWF